MFSINNVVSLCQNQPSKLFAKHRDGLTLFFDVMMVALLVFTAVTAAQGGHMDWFGIASYTNPWTLGMGIAALTVFAAGSVTAIIRLAKKPAAKVQLATKQNKQQIQADIERAARAYDMFNPANQQEAAKLFARNDLNRASVARITSHVIVNGLHLGNGNTISLDVSAPDPHPFNHIITVCPLGHCGEIEYSEEQARGGLKKHNPSVNWLYVGRATNDRSGAWATLVHDCTAPLSALAVNSTNHDPHAEEKAAALTGMPVETWFNPVFDVIDRAVMGEETVLVHCGQGVSRSATILAAYLINRFEVTSEQAIFYLMSKRSCVSPNRDFCEKLKEYEMALRKARASSQKPSSDGSQSN